MEFDILFEPVSNVSNTSIIKAFEDGNSTKELGSLNIIGGITVTEQLPVTEMTTQSPSASTTAPTESEKLYTWVMVLIAAGAVVLVLLLIIIALTLKYRLDVQTAKAELPSFDGYWELMTTKQGTMRAHVSDIYNANAAYENGATNLAHTSLFHMNEIDDQAVYEAYFEDTSL
ncbi:hypothetical protein ACROYT_G036512 [Oculina patagonica]